MQLGPARTPGCPRTSTIIDDPAKEGLKTPNIAAIMRQHVSLEVRCLDRLYLYAYLPKLQTSGGLSYERNGTTRPEDPAPGGRDRSAG